AARADMRRSTVDFTTTVEAEARIDIAAVRCVRYHLPAPINHALRSDVCRLDLCLTPRPPDLVACYPDHWGKRRFEPSVSLFVAPAGELLHIKSDIGGKRPEGESQRSLVCELDPKLVTRWYDGELEWTASRLSAGLDLVDESLRGLMKRLIREVRRPGFA